MGILYDIGIFQLGNLYFSAEIKLSRYFPPGKWVIFSIFLLENFVFISENYSGYLFPSRKNTLNGYFPEDNNIIY